MTTADAWAKGQREGWLAKLYGKPSNDDSSNDGKVLSQDTIQWQLVDVLHKMLSHKLPPSEAASQAATLIVSQQDPGTPLSNLSGIYFSAVQGLSDERSLVILVEFLVALASLPDAVNNTGETQKIDEGGMNTTVEPGENITKYGLKIWWDMPDFNMTLTESFDGPELYIHSASSNAANPGERWTNINTWVALLAASAQAQTIPSLARKVNLAPYPFYLGLECSPTSRRGEYSALSVPATRNWLRIAGDELEKHCERDDSDETDAKKKREWEAGDLWAAEGGGSAVDLRRLAFWRRRLDEIEREGKHQT